MMRTSTWLLGIFGSGMLGACGAKTAQPALIKRHSHDFGVVAHGQRPAHTFELRLGDAALGYHPIGFQSDCSCASVELRLTRAGADQPELLPAFPTKRYRLAEGDALDVVMTLETDSREGIDLSPQTRQGSIVLQRDDDENDILRIQLAFSYSIDAPVDVMPAAHVDIGGIHPAQGYRESVELRADRPQTRFGPVETSDPILRAELREEGGTQLLDLELRPDEQRVRGPFRFLVRVSTDLPGGYVVEIPVSGEYLPDVQIQPHDHISFGRFDLALEKVGFVNLRDNVKGRAADFDIKSVAPYGDHVEARIEAINGDERSRRLVVRYRGTLDPKTLEFGSFRGSVHIGKPGSPRILATVSFVGFHRSAK